MLTSEDDFSIFLNEDLKKKKKIHWTVNMGENIKQTGRKSE